MAVTRSKTAAARNASNVRTQYHRCFTPQADSEYKNVSQAPKLRIIYRRSQQKKDNSPTPIAHAPKQKKDNLPTPIAHAPKKKKIVRAENASTSTSMNQDDNWEVEEDEEPASVVLARLPEWKPSPKIKWTPGRGFSRVL